MLAWVGKICDRLCVVIGAFIFSQFPAFLQQYTQRLGGHLAELNYQVRELQQIAMKSGKTLPEYIHKFSSSGDGDFSQHGALMIRMLERQVELSDSLRSLTQATTWMRPIEFAKHLQWDIARGTATDFQPALSLTVEGVLYALAGMFAGYALYATFSRGLRLVRLGCLASRRA